MGTDARGFTTDDDPPELQEFDRLLQALTGCNWHEPTFKGHLQRFEAFMARPYAAMMEKYPSIDRTIIGDAPRNARAHHGLWIARSILSHVVGGRGHVERGDHVRQLLPRGLDGARRNRPRIRRKEILTASCSSGKLKARPAA